MDPSAFIFVGLALAWAAYLIPKALEHHDAAARTRTVDKFSHTLRVIARREPVDRRKTQLVTNRAAAAVAEVPETRETVESSAPFVPEADQTGFFAAQTFVRRSAASQAVRRRRRVLGVLLVLTAMVAAGAAGRVIGSWWVVVPITLLVAWLVACRLMVKGERAAHHRVVQRVGDPVEPHDTGIEDVFAVDDTAEVPAVRAEVAAGEPIAAGGGWELVPVTLPTYVSKPAAHRTVSTIDLDSTGVWTSGHTAADSALAQQADAVRAAGTEAAQGAQSQRRISGA